MCRYKDRLWIWSMADSDIHVFDIHTDENQMHSSWHNPDCLRLLLKPFSAYLTFFSFPVFTRIDGSEWINWNSIKSRCSCQNKKKGILRFANCSKPSYFWLAIATRMNQSSFYLHSECREKFWLLTGSDKLIWMQSSEDLSECLPVHP